MAVTVSGTSITFNDATVQTTAAVAPTTAQVLTATAGASVGAVGTYAWMYNNSGGTNSPGGTAAGSSLRYGGFSTDGASVQFAGSGTASAGTWRCMGFAAQAGYPLPVTLYLRIS